MCKDTSYILIAKGGGEDHFQNVIKLSICDVAVPIFIDFPYDSHHLCKFMLILEICQEISEWNIFQLLLVDPPEYFSGISSSVNRCIIMVFLDFKSLVHRPHLLQERLIINHTYIDKLFPSIKPTAGIEQ